MLYDAFGGPVRGVRFFSLWFLFACLSAAAGEIWIPAPILETQYSHRYLPGEILPEAEIEKQVRQCLRSLSAKYPTYESDCREGYGRYSERGGVNHSLLGAHLFCDLHCDEAVFVVGRCRVEKYIDDGGWQKIPFLLLVRSDPYRVLNEPVYLGKGVSEMGAVALVIAEGARAPECEP